MTRLAHALLALWHRVTAVARRRRIARDVDEELAFHLAMRALDERADVPDDDAARRAARQRFGNPVAIAEETRAMWTFQGVESVARDVRFALRTLRRTPAFTAVAVFALAVGIGANTAIFSLVDATLVRGLPYADSDRLVVLIGNVQRETVERRGGSYPDFLDWRAQATVFEGLAAYDGLTATLTAGGGEPERVSLEAVSPAYFDVLGRAPALGRAFLPHEDAADAPVAVLSHGFWQRRFGGDGAVLGRTIRLGPTTYQIVGVMPPGFSGLTDQAALWIPFRMGGYPLENRGSRWLQGIGRLRPDASVAAAQAELDTISRRLEQAYPATNDKYGVEVAPLAAETFGRIRPAVLALMASVTLVLLMACANVANLLISRSEARQREIAVRAALGAGRGRLLRQLVTESLVLSALGAAAGLVLASAIIRALIAWSPVTLPSFVSPGLHGTALAFTAGVTIACGLLLGIAPALHARTHRLGEVLKASARGSTGASARLRAALVVAEVALAVVLVVGAGLMIRTVRNLVAVDPGFETGSMLTLNAGTPRDDTAPASPGTPPAFVASWREIQDRIGSLPGVSSVALISDLPLQGDGSATFYSAEGHDITDAASRPRAYVHRATPGFFETMGVRLLHGRTFTESELSVDSGAIVVSESLVRRFWPGADPIGRRIKFGPPQSPAPWLTIVGVVPDVRYRALPDNPTADPDVYLPYTDRAVHALMIRTAGDPAAAIPSVRRALTDLHPAIVTYNLAPLSDRVAAWTAQSRFTSWLMGIFAGMALLLALVGIYGVMAYLVAQRTREFGIRLALGAGRARIVGTVMRQGALLVTTGVAIGTAAAFASARWAESLVFGVETTGPAAFAPVLLLLAVALLAYAVPAVRATRVNPAEALRGE